MLVDIHSRKEAMIKMELFPPKSVSLAVLEMSA